MKAKHVVGSVDLAAKNSLGGASRIKAHFGNVEGKGIKVCEKLMKLQ